MEEANAFSVTPMQQMLELKPGETYTGSITVINPAGATENFDYVASANPYGVVSENYDIDIVTMTNWTRMTEWITIENPTGSLAPNETAEIKFAIQVPKDAPAGGQYAAISVGIDDQKQAYDNMTITNRMEIASVIYAKVAGKTVRKGEVLENNVPFFSFTTPITVGALINNEGNVHEEAEVAIRVTDVFTGQVILPTKSDDGIHTEIVMPETTKRVTREIGDLPFIGIVKVKQNIYYNYQMSVVEKCVIICPVWFLILVLIALGAIVGGIVTIIRKHRKKRKLKLQ